MHEFGWTGYLRTNVRPSFSLSKITSKWSPGVQVRYNTLADRAWSRAKFVARPLASKWKGKLQPLLAINSSRLVVAAGNNFYPYQFVVPKRDGDPPALQFEGLCALSEDREVKRDITGLVSISDGGLDRTFVVGYEDGALERVSLTPSSKHGEASLTAEYSFRLPNRDLIESLSSAEHRLLSLSASGSVAFIDTSSPSVLSNTVELHARSWTSYLCTTSSTPYAAFGTSSTSPLVVHSIANSEISQTPNAILYPSAKHDAFRSSAVYGISGAPPSSPWGSSNQVIVSGWYDGLVRVHDLRSSSRAPSTPEVTPLLPVMSLCDPWSFEPIYTVSCGGGSSSHIAAGSARHSVVSFWDVRYPKHGWSVHAPGNDSSPVYEIILESSRLFGATESRPFVYDFGPGITEDTYPRLHHNQGLRPKKGSNGVSFYVTKYHHNHSGSAWDN